LLGTIPHRLHFAFFNLQFALCIEQERTRLHPRRPRRSPRHGRRKAPAARDPHLLRLRRQVFLLADRSETQAGRSAQAKTDNKHPRKPTRLASYRSIRGRLAQAGLHSRIWKSSNRLEWQKISQGDPSSPQEICAISDYGDRRASDDCHKAQKDNRLGCNVNDMRLYLIAPSIVLHRHPHSWHECSKSFTQTPQKSQKCKKLILLF
jgi:hypothetical protein